MPFEFDVRVREFIHNDERNRGELREPIRFVDRNRRPAAPRIRIFGILVVLAAPVAPDPECFRAE